MAECKGQVFVDERAIIVQSRWIWGAASRNLLYLQISRQQFGADSSIIFKFIALRVEMVRFSCSQPLIIL